jgi:hypothetical protein
MAGASAPRAGGRLAAALVLLLLVASLLFFWLGIPVLILWGLSKATDSATFHFVFGLMSVPLGMAVFSPVLFLLNGLYVRLTTGLPVEQPGVRRRVRGPLEPLLVLSLLVSVVALVIWFFFLAENPPRQFI